MSQRSIRTWTGILLSLALTLVWIGAGSADARPRAEAEESRAGSDRSTTHQSGRVSSEPADATRAKGKVVAPRNAEPTRGVLRPEPKASGPVVPGPHHPRHPDLHGSAKPDLILLNQPVWHRTAHPDIGWLPGPFIFKNVGAVPVPSSQFHFEIRCHEDAICLSASYETALDPEGSFTANAVQPSVSGTPLAPGETRSFQFTDKLYTSCEQIQGSCGVTITVDPNDGIGESNEVNNRVRLAY